ncbi:hypothetical protein H6504_03520 [Candidatus Woesearchaeota archaeon]|nr:hypothetical protein [Candidatus Woesearchaeota archaeon]
MLRQKIGMTTSTLISMALGIVLFIVLLFMIQNGSLMAFWDSSTGIVDSAQVQACMKDQELNNKNQEDCDNDGIYDVCDFCLGADNRLDGDNDGTPDHCDEDPGNSKKKKCNGELIELGNYKYCEAHEISGCEEKADYFRELAGEK